MLLQSPLKHKLSRGLRFTGSEQCEKAKRLKHNFGLLKIHLHQATPHVTGSLQKTSQTQISLKQLPSNQERLL